MRPSSLKAQAIGLGNRFLDEIDRVVLDIANLPILWPITKYGTRKRILVSPFPIQYITILLMMK